MKKLYYAIATFSLMIAIVATTANESLTKSAAAPFSNTGSPGDGGSGQTCAKVGCHATTVNTGQGTLTIDLSDIPAAGWTPGQTYTIGVDLSESGKGTFGFQLTVEDGSGNKKGSFTGNNNVVIASQFWPTHKSTSATGSWTFDWTAPSDNSQQLTFYAAGNAANGNGNGTGDNIYTTSVNSDRDPIAGVEDLNAQNSIKVLGNPVVGQLVTEAPLGTVLNVYSLNGQREMSFRQMQSINSISVEKLSSGIYLLADQKGTYSTRFVVK